MTSRNGDVVYSTERSSRRSRVRGRLAFGSSSAESSKKLNESRKWRETLTPLSSSTSPAEIQCGDDSLNFFAVDNPALLNDNKINTDTQSKMKTPQTPQVGPQTVIHHKKPLLRRRRDRLKKRQHQNIESRDNKHGSCGGGAAADDDDMDFEHTPKPQPSAEDNLDQNQFETPPNNFSLGADKNSSELHPNTPQSRTNSTASFATQEQIVGSNKSSDVHDSSNDILSNEYVDPSKNPPRNKPKSGKSSKLSDQAYPQRGISISKSSILHNQIQDSIISPHLLVTSLKSCISAQSDDEFNRRTIFVNFNGSKLKQGVQCRTDDSIANSCDITKTNTQINSTKTRPSKATTSRQKYQDPPLHIPETELMCQSKMIQHLVTNPLYPIDEASLSIGARLDDRSSQSTSQRELNVALNEDVVTKNKTYSDDTASTSAIKRSRFIGEPNLSSGTSNKDASSETTPQPKSTEVFHNYCETRNLTKSPKDANKSPMNSSRLLNVLPDVPQEKFGETRLAKLQQSNCDINECSKNLEHLRTTYTDQIVQDLKSNSEDFYNKVNTRSLGVVGRELPMPSNNPHRHRRFRRKGNTPASMRKNDNEGSENFQQDTILELLQEDDVSSMGLVGKDEVIASASFTPPSVNNLACEKETLDKHYISTIGQDHESVGCSFIGASASSESSTNFELDSHENSPSITRVRMFETKVDANIKDVQTPNSCTCNTRDVLSRQDAGEYRCDEEDCLYLCGTIVQEASSKQHSVSSLNDICKLILLLSDNGSLPKYKRKCAIICRSVAVRRAILEALATIPNLPISNMNDDCAYLLHSSKIESSLSSRKARQAKPSRCLFATEKARFRSIPQPRDIHSNQSDSAIYTIKEKVSIGLALLAFIVTEATSAKKDEEQTQQDESIQKFARSSYASSPPLANDPFHDLQSSFNDLNSWWNVESNSITRSSLSDNFCNGLGRLIHLMLLPHHTLHSSLEHERGETFSTRLDLPGRSYMMDFDSETHTLAENKPVNTSPTLIHSAGGGNRDPTKCGRRKRKLMSPKTSPENSYETVQIESHSSLTNRTKKILFNKDDSRAVKCTIIEETKVLDSKNDAKIDDIELESDAPNTSSSANQDSSDWRKVLNFLASLSTIENVVDNTVNGTPTHSRWIEPDSIDFQRPRDILRTRSSEVPCRILAGHLVIRVLDQMAMYSASGSSSIVSDEKSNCDKEANANYKSSLNIADSLCCSADNKVKDMCSSLNDQLTNTRGLTSNALRLVIEALHLMCYDVRKSFSHSPHEEPSIHAENPSYWHETNGCCYCGNCRTLLYSRFGSLLEIVDGVCCLSPHIRNFACLPLTKSPSTGERTSLIACLFEVISYTHLLVSTSSRNEMSFSPNDTIQIELKAQDIMRRCLATLTSLGHENELAGTEMMNLRLPTSFFNNLEENLKLRHSGICLLLDIFRTLVLDFDVGNNSSEGKKSVYDSIIYCMNILTNALDLPGETGEMAQLEMLSINFSKRVENQIVKGQDQMHSVANPAALFIANWATRQTAPFRRELGTSRVQAATDEKSKSDDENTLSHLEEESLVLAGNGFILLTMLILDRKDGTLAYKDTVLRMRESVLAEISLQANLVSPSQLMHPLVPAFDFVSNTLKAFVNYYHYSVGALSVAVVAPVVKLLAALDDMKRSCLQ